MFTNARFVSAALSAVGLLAVSASAMAVTPALESGQSALDTRPAQAVQATATPHAVDSAWVFSSDGRNQPIH